MKSKLNIGSIALAVLVIGLMGSWSWLPTPPVFAHANLARSEPAPNSVLDQPPNRVVIWFTEPVEENFSEIQVLDSQGQQVDNADSSVDANDPTVMSVTLPILPNGTYTVAWRNLSIVDGHTIRGAFVFSVGEPISSAPTDQTAEAPLVQSPLEPLFRWLVLLGALALVGGLAFDLLVTRPSLLGSNPNQNLRQLAGRIASRNFKLLLIALGVLLAGLLGQLAVQTSAVNDLPLQQTIGRPMLLVLTGTQWGLLWLWRAGLLWPILLLLLLSRWSDRRQKGLLQNFCWSLALVISAAVLATISLSSHGAATERIRTAAIFSDYVHLLAAAVWVGGLFHLALGIPIILQVQSQSQRRAILSALVPRFSIIAILSVGTLIITGLYSGWAQVTIAEAVATPYGLTLAAKLGLVGLLLFLGALNLLWVRPKLASDEGAGRWLRRLVTGEAALAVLVLLSVGMLTSLEPARQVASRLGLGQEDQLSFRDTAEGAEIALKAEPGQVGPNRFILTLTDRLGRPITNATEVRLDLAYLDADLGTTSIQALPTDPGKYVIEDELLSLAGPWQAGLVVRRPDAFDARTAFRFEVAPAGVNSAQIVPDADTGKFLWGVELALLGFLFIATAIPMGGWWTQRGAIVMGSGLAAFLVGVFLAFNTQIVGTGDTNSLTNPFPPTAESLSTGQRLYQKHCQSCHGAEGRGDGPLAAGLEPPPADLVVHVPLHFDQALFNFVENGVPGTAMTPLGDEMTDEEIWHLINYIKTFEEPLQ
jgi:copper transport protein